MDNKEATATSSQNDMPSSSDSVSHERKENEEGTQCMLSSDVKVIADNGHMMVPKVPLCMASPVFDSMLNSDFQKSSNNEVQLPGKSLETIEFIARYINLREPCPIQGGELLENIMAFAEEYLIGRLKIDCSDYMKKTLASNSDVTTKEVLRFHLLARRFVLADVEEITTKILQSTHTSKLEACENFTKIGLEEVFYNRVKNAEDVIRGSRKVIEDFGKALRRQVDDTTCYTHNDMCDPTCRRCIDSCISFRCTLSKTLNKHGGDSVSNRPINRILEKSEQFVL